MKQLSGLISTVLFLFFSQFAFSQFTENKEVRYKELVDSLIYVKEIPYIENCNDPILWKIVKEGKSIVPFLIEKMTDGRVLERNLVPFFGGEYTVADVAYIALTEIIWEIPTYNLLGIKPSKECGDCSFWYKIREGKKVRKKFQQAVKKWYEQNEENLVLVNSTQSFNGDCFLPSHTRYKIFLPFQNYTPIYQLECGLWMNSNKDIAYKDIALVHNSRLKIEDFKTEDYYIFKVYNQKDTINYEIDLKDIIDTKSFQFIGDYCFKDKNRAYIFIPQVYGGYLVVNDDIDVESFKALDNHAYTCDKNSCFVLGKEIENIDIQSFRVLIDEFLISRDKNNFYYHNIKMEEKDIELFKQEEGIDIKTL